MQRFTPEGCPRVLILFLSFDGYPVILRVEIPHQLALNGEDSTMVFWRITKPPVSLINWLSRISFGSVSVLNRAILMQMSRDSDKTAHGRHAPRSAAIVRATAKTATLPANLPNSA